MSRKQKERVRLTALNIFFIVLCFITLIRSVYKELHADHETGAADNK